MKKKKEKKVRDVMIGVRVTKKLKADYEEKVKLERRRPAERIYMFLEEYTYGG